MANENLKRDQNYVTVLGAITDDGNQEVRMLRIDPVTKRLLVSAIITSSVNLTVEEQDGIPSVTGVNKIKFPNGSVTDDGGGVVSINFGSGSGDVTGPASSIDNEIALFSGTTGKIIKRATGTGIVKATSGVFSTGTITTSEITTNAVTDTILRQSAGLSVVGRSANTTGNVADIIAGTDNQVLRRSGTTIGFGAINLSASAAVTGLLGVSNGGTGANTFSTNGILVGNGTSAVSTTNTPHISSVRNPADGGFSIFFDGVLSSANTLRTSNSIAGSPLLISASGSDANISINMVPKGTGRLQVSTVNVPTISSTDILTNKTITDSTNNVTANGLRTATTTVSVSSAAAPSVGQVLTATSATTATWQTPSGGGSEFVISSKPTTYWTTQIPFGGGAGVINIAPSGWETSNVSSFSVYPTYAQMTTTSSSGFLRTQLSSSPNTSQDFILWSTTKKIVTSFAYQVTSSVSHMFGLAGLSSSVFTSPTNVDEGLRFVWDGTNMYARSSNGTSATNSSNFTGFSNICNLFRIEYDPGVEARFYVNNVLRATITTNLPTSATKINIGAGCNSTSTTITFASCPVVSVEL